MSVSQRTAQNIRERLLKKSDSSAKFVPNILRIGLADPERGRFPLIALEKAVREKSDLGYHCFLAELLIVQREVEQRPAASWFRAMGRGWD
jgi:hypothetical protein